jgi:metal-responsive CopG/Arc/MetJ family transcriptional regulator
MTAFMEIELKKSDPRDRDWAPVGIKLPRYMIEVLDEESDRLCWKSRNRVVVELLRPWVYAHEAKKKAEKKGGAK